MSKLYTWQQIARAIDLAYKGEPTKQKAVKRRVRASLVALKPRKDTSVDHQLYDGRHNGDANV